MKVVDKSLFHMFLHGEPRGRRVLKHILSSSSLNYIVILFSKIVIYISFVSQPHSRCVGLFILCQAFNDTLQV